MADERDIFDLSGPRHLTNINWSDPNHMRCLSASLVKGASVLEVDRAESRSGQEASASKWWSFFDFQLVEKANEGNSIFGAVYKWHGDARPPEAPEIVVAFRGTQMKSTESFVRDMNLNLKLIRNGLHRTGRFRTALDLVQKYVSWHGAKNVWIAGHSLGAAIAMLVGRRMAKDGQLLQAHLFNPPFCSVLVDRIGNNNLQWGYLIRDLAVCAAAVALRDKQSRIQSQKAFLALGSWVPRLYVNTMDDICSAYVPYFSHHQMMQQIGAGTIANLAARHSIRDLCSSAIGIESEAFYRIPSARLTVNVLVQTPDSKRAARIRQLFVDSRKAHAIYQWWAPDLKIQCSECRISKGCGILKEMAPAMLVASAMLQAMLGVF